MGATHPTEWVVWENYWGGLGDAEPEVAGGGPEVQNLGARGAVRRVATILRRF